jgi:restriction system protein
MLATLLLLLASANTNRITEASSLLLQAIITPGRGTPEGQLVEAVALPGSRLSRRWTATLPWRTKYPGAKGEEMVAGAYLAAKFDLVTLTPRSGDFGRDVIAEKHGVGTIRVIDQVKAHRPGHRVTADDMRALMVCCT